MSDRPLTAKQLRFVEHYIELGNGTEAARLAGYEGSTGTLALIASENIRKPKIAAAIEQRRAQAAQRAEISAAWVLREYRATYERATAAEDYGPARQCLHDLAKHLGLFPRDNHVTNVDARSVQVLAGLTLDELRALAGRASPATEGEVVDGGV